MIEITHLTKKYGEKIAINDISFAVAKGEIVGLIGKNGAGKSTILKAIAGLLEYEDGNILYNGMRRRQDWSGINDFGILIDCAFLDYISAYDNLKLLYQLDARNAVKDVDRVIDEVFELVGLENVKRKRVKTYSFGMKQRLGLAQAIINAKTFIILDEPFIGLDPIGKEIVKKAILRKAKKDNYSILFSSHNLEDVAEICDRIVMIDNGICVYDGTIKHEQEYHIHLKDMSAMAKLARQWEQLPHFRLFEEGFSFIDDENCPQISTVLSAVLKETEILKIESGENILKGMFSEEGNKNETNH